MVVGQWQEGVGEKKGCILLPKCCHSLNGAVLSTSRICEFLD